MSKHERVRDIQQYFEGLFQQGITPWTQHAIDDSIPDFAARLLERRATPSLLDLGCGNGWLSVYFAQRGIYVEGIDSSPTAIAEAATMAAEKGVLSYVHFQVGDGLALPYPPASFDAVFDRGFFHHVPPDYYPVYLEGVLRVLVAGGLLSLHTFSLRNHEGIGHRFGRDDVARIFGDYFILREHRFDPWPTDAPAHLGHYLLEKKAST